MSFYNVKLESSLTNLTPRIRCLIKYLLKLAIRPFLEDRVVLPSIEDRVSLASTAVYTYPLEKQAIEEVFYLFKR